MIRAENIIVDKRVSSYYSQSSIPENAQEILAVAKNGFEDKKLRRSFDFMKINDHLDAWEETIKDSDLPEKADVMKLVRNLKKKGLAMQGVSQSFEKQLAMLTDDASLEGGSESILERGEKGINYFTDEVYIKLIQPLEDHKRAYKIKPRTRKYVREVEDLISHLWSYIEGLYSLQYRDVELFPHPPKYKRIVLFNPDKKDKKPKREKGETQKITLEMWEEGKTIEEICKLRSLKIGTIQTHMSKWIKSGKVDIKTLMDMEKVEEIWKTIKDNPDKSSAEIREIVPFSVEYSELSMVRNWAHFKGLDEEKADSN